MINNLEKEIKYLCKKNKIKPLKNKGQNFVINSEIINKIIKAADLKQNDLVLEVGPGFGALTTELIKKADEVMAVELDKNLFQVLEKLKEVNKNLIIVNNDILKLGNEEIARTLKAKEIIGGIYNYKLVANIPYNITSFFLKKFLSYSERPKVLVLLLQKELAERLVASPGEMSLLAISCQFYAEPKIIEIVSKENFWPQPKVDSAIIRIKAIDQKERFNLPQDFNEKKFWQIIKIGFSARRKQLKNNLSSGLKISDKLVIKIFKKISLNSTIRAQELTINNWLEIYNNLYCKKNEIVA
jgi:16S rRNA (adenine1518-N6/adenine1519-N6)-dimethyltransferase